MSWARRLLRELPNDPEEMLRSRSYADVTFLPLFFEWLDELIFHDPREGLRWAKVAPELARAAPEEDGPQAHQERAVKAYAILGSAYRAAGNHDASDESYRSALKLAAAGKVSELVRADTDRRLSTLRACQSRPEEALTLASGAAETLRGLGSDDERQTVSRLLWKALIATGYALFGLRRYGKAIDLFGEALAGALAGATKRKRRTPDDRRSDKRIHASACHNIALAISESPDIGDHRRALLYLRQAREQIKGKRPSGARFRLIWVEALIMVKLGAHAKAETYFRRSLAGFEALRLPWERALVAIDLGEVLRMFGEWVELEALASDAFQRFRLLSGDTGAVTALSQWLDAVRARKLEDELTASVRQIIAAGVFSGHCCRSR